MLREKRVCVAIPVRNEQDHIGACLTALRWQTRPADEVLLLLNDCDDETFALCRATQDLLPLRIVEARRLALSAASDLPEVGVILSTDADAMPPDDWIGANLAALARGAAAVCGTAHLHPTDAAKIPPRLFADHRIEVECAAALDAPDAALDSDPADPWPRRCAAPAAHPPCRTARIGS